MTTWESIVDTNFDANIHPFLADLGTSAWSAADGLDGSGGSLLLGAGAETIASVQFSRECFLGRIRFNVKYKCIGTGPTMGQMYLLLRNHAELQSGRVFGTVLGFGHSHAQGLGGIVNPWRALSGYTFAPEALTWTNIIPSEEIGMANAWHELRGSFNKLLYDKFTRAGQSMVSTSHDVLETYPMDEVVASGVAITPPTFDPVVTTDPGGVGNLYRLYCVFPAGQQVRIGKVKIEHGVD